MRVVNVCVYGMYVCVVCVCVWGGGGSCDWLGGVYALINLQVL